MKKLLIICTCTVLMIACKKSADVSVVTEPSKTISNVSYGGNPLQTIDAFLPAGRSSANTKSIILIHGGAWSSGDKADVAQYVDSFKKRLPDYAIFNLNYRLSVNASTLFPIPENDVKSAVQFILSQAINYKISNKYAIIGVSAGGHLGLLQAYKNSGTIKPLAVVSFFGPTDLTDMYNNPTNQYVPIGLQQVIGKTPSQDPLIYANSSPINFVTSSAPPTLLLHGGVDILVNASQSVALKNKLQAAGVINQYIFYPNEGHGWYGTTLSDSFDHVQAFLIANVQ